MAGDTPMNDNLTSPGDMGQSEEKRVFAKKTIAWEKWKDPFGNNNEDEDCEESHDDGYGGDEIDKDSMNKPMKMLMTPLGMLSLDEYTRPEKIFNFWVGHTNFPISRYIAQVINDVEGVEILNILTRYRFRVSCGKLYDDQKVRIAIAEAVKKIVSD